MPLVSDRCICLRKTPYSETSQILTLFSRTHGLLRVIAKGAHRTTKAGASKFGGGIDLLDLADAVFTHNTDRDLSTLTEWSLQDGHLESCIKNLATPALEQSFLAFQIELLRETGYLPELTICTSCGRPITTTSANQISFSPDRGGTLCRNCETAFPHRLTLNPRLLNILQLFATNGATRLPILTRHQTDPINKLLAEYIEHTLGRRLRLPKYVVGKMP